MLKMKTRLFVSFWLIGILITNAQIFDKKYFNEVLDTLTSNSFVGRGYVEDGMNKAGNYLQNEFKKNGLKSFSTNYTQNFTFPINIIKNATLKIDGKELKYGTDFIVKPSSRSVSESKLAFYTLNTKEYLESFQFKEKTKNFIIKDDKLQKTKNIILPPLATEVDSIKKYYKQWANIYEKNEPENRAIFRFYFR